MCDCEDGKPEYGWLVEGVENGRPVWLCVGRVGLVWSTDSYNAVRFARKYDGEAFIRFMTKDFPAGTAIGLTVTEHQWI